LCGLVGMAGRVMGAEKKAFKLLHYFDEVRGEHSSGLAVVKENTNFVNIYKAVGNVHDLWDEYHDKFDQKDHTLNSWNEKVYIGHNRFATMGARTAKNAHPFQHGKIVGAHNGTLTYRWLDQLEGNDLFEVDSEAIFYSINKKGLADTIATMHGAWALVFWDGVNETVNFIRNKERTLFYTWTEDYKTLFWASEEWMLRVALGKAGIKFVKVEPFIEDYHYELHVPKNGMNLKDGSLVYYEEKLKGFQPPLVQNQKQLGHESWWESEAMYPYEQGYYGGNRFSGNQNNNVKKPEENNNNVVTFPKKDKPPKETKEEGDSYLIARSFLQKDVEFLIYGERKLERTGVHLIADTNGLPDGWEIRLFAQHNENFKEWRKCEGVYIGKIGGICNKWDDKAHKFERFLTVDLRTIRKKEVETPPKKEEKATKEEKPKPALDIVLENQLVWDVNRSYKGFKGASLSFGEFMKAVNAGCVWCGEVINPTEADDVTFVQPGRFACKICTGGGHALKYYGQK
jgi:predicted glutamine amidotransferase